MYIKDKTYFVAWIYSKCLSLLKCSKFGSVVLIGTSRNTVMCQLAHFYKQKLKNLAGFDNNNGFDLNNVLKLYWLCIQQPTMEQHYLCIHLIYQQVHKLIQDQN